MSAAVQDSTEPATGSTLGSVVVTDPGHVARAVEASAAVQPLWAQLRLADRSRASRGARSPRRS